MGRIYSTKQWQQVRKIYLNLHPICEVCQKLDRITPASQVDHVKAIEDGGAAFDLANCMALCQRHHSRKTVMKDRGFGNKVSTKPLIAGCDINGLPIDPHHHWNRGTASS